MTIRPTLVSFSFEKKTILQSCLKNIVSSKSVKEKMFKKSSTTIKPRTSTINSTQDKSILSTTVVIIIVIVKNKNNNKSMINYKKKNFKQYKYYIFYVPRKKKKKKPRGDNSLKYTILCK